MTPRVRSIATNVFLTVGFQFRDRIKQSTCLTMHNIISYMLYSLICPPKIILVFAKEICAYSSADHSLPRSGSVRRPSITADVCIPWRCYKLRLEEWSRWTAQKYRIITLGPDISTSCDAIGSAVDLRYFVTASSARHLVRSAICRSMHTWKAFRVAHPPK